MPLVIATPAHATAMAAIHGGAFPTDPWTPAAFTTLLAQPGVTGFIDPAGGLAMLRVAADEAEILTIGVTAPRQGIGHRMMLAAIEAAQAAGATQVFLEVAASNRPALALYSALGFAAVGARRGYYADGGDAVLLRFIL